MGASRRGGWTARRSGWRARDVEGRQMEARGGEEGCEEYGRTRRMVHDRVEAREAGADGAIAA